MKKVLLVIIDGFGYRKEKAGNAILNAEMTTYKYLYNKFPHSILQASGRSVGLNDNQMGNSEVGHLSIGAGKVVKQNVTQITEMFNNDELKDNDTFNDMVSYVNFNDKPLHLMALVSDGGIHSHIKFILRMIDELHKNKVKKVYVHAITDGRDSDIHSALKYISSINDKLASYNMGKVVDICGRYYAMDRDKKYGRTKYYSDLVTLGKGYIVKDLEATINLCYSKDVTDEFLPPLVLDQNNIIRDGDALLWFNYRPDRAKQILNVLTNDKFMEYPTVSLSNLKVYTIYNILEAINSKHLLERIQIKNPLGVYLSSLGLTQARVAETEKYAHVTYFFDGGEDLVLDGCDRYLIESPKVATYDMKPEMSVNEVTKKVIKCINNNYDFIVVNIANPDMVGHTGNYEAAIKALEAVDVSLGLMYECADENFYTTFIVSDHGNVDIMVDEDGNEVTTHTLSPVPFIVCDKKVSLKDGSICDIAPTILKYMDIKIPKEMKESNILIK